jgi:hypothetical protein
VLVVDADRACGAQVKLSCEQLWRFRDGECPYSLIDQELVKVERIFCSNYLIEAVLADLARLVNSVESLYFAVFLKLQGEYLALLTRGVR